MRRVLGPTTAAHSCGVSVSQPATRAANPGTSPGQLDQATVEARRAVRGADEEQPGAVHQSAGARLAGRRRSPPRRRGAARPGRRGRRSVGSAAPRAVRRAAACGGGVPGRGEHRREGGAHRRAGRRRSRPVTRGSSTARAAGPWSSRRSTYAASVPGGLRALLQRPPVRGWRPGGRRAGVVTSARVRRASPPPPGPCSRARNAASTGSGWVARAGDQGARRQPRVAGGEAPQRLRQIAGPGARIPDEERRARRRAGWRRRGGRAG